jgi:hypothetical protein
MPRRRHERDVIPVTAAADFLVNWALWTLMTGQGAPSPPTAAAVQEMLPTPSNEPVKTGETAENTGGERPRQGANNNPSDQRWGTSSCTSRG